MSYLSNASEYSVSNASARTASKVILLASSEETFLEQASQTHRKYRIKRFSRAVWNFSIVIPWFQFCIKAS